MGPRTCVSPEGKFIVGIHRPNFKVENLRNSTYHAILGSLPDGSTLDNQTNFPQDTIEEAKADTVYEIANPFSFRGATFINSAWADPKAGQAHAIKIPEPPPCSLFGNISSGTKENKISPKEKKRILDLLPRPLLIALAQASTNPEELAALARKCCSILFDKESGLPAGMGFAKTPGGGIRPIIYDHEVFEVLVNNPYLPDAYKEVLVLRPGIQGKSEIVGEYTSRDGKTHVFEYLRRNSYIPWGHFASNMANDAIRYRAKDLSPADMTGIRHLYYQRIYVRIYSQLGYQLPVNGRCMTQEELESLRKDIIHTLETQGGENLEFNGALWGWNFGFGFAQSGHRLHASHQMIHQQNAMVPDRIKDFQGNPYDSFSCGDLVSDFIRKFKAVHGRNFFDSYIDAIHTNERTDGRPCADSSLIVHENEQVILFAPKAQVSEWELQLITKTPCSNILQADSAMREALDTAMLKAIQALEFLGAKMVTAIEFSGRINSNNEGQHLVYSFIPRLPHAPDTFSEAQLRFISGCYPEDFAHACARALDRIHKETQ